MNTDGVVATNGHMDTTGASTLRVLSDDDGSGIFGEVHVRNSVASSHVNNMNVNNNNNNNNSGSNVQQNVHDDNSTINIDLACSRNGPSPPPLPAQSRSSKSNGKSKNSSLFVPNSVSFSPQMHQEEYGADISDIDNVTNLERKGKRPSGASQLSYMTDGTSHGEGQSLQAAFSVASFDPRLQKHMAKESVNESNVSNAVNVVNDNSNSSPSSARRMSKHKKKRLKQQAQQQQQAQENHDEDEKKSSVIEEKEKEIDKNFDIFNKIDVRELDYHSYNDLIDNVSFDKLPDIPGVFTLKKAHCVELPRGKMKQSETYYLRVYEGPPIEMEGPQRSKTTSVSTAIEPKRHPKSNSTTVSATQSQTQSPSQIGKKSGGFDKRKKIRPKVMPKKKALPSFL